MTKANDINEMFLVVQQAFIRFIFIPLGDLNHSIMFRVYTIKITLFFQKEKNERENLFLIFIIVLIQHFYYTKFNSFPCFMLKAIYHYRIIQMTLDYYTHSPGLKNIIV